ncbi:hypothetical protein CAOG_02669 [Capsaspora owczarzaki ATCC 30864]|uniref:hypothetical protein n=1 Tax=Capsaspora owczarzaki (strain ATCC 30864) TaxID=595528 RepID=UPI0003525201|nr:hypothetical protein CAOG_02669 [Capsaspora owczarzaki ATCC 30864]|eukprot:XP_004349419.2 hypothetical protein CAOG_02669 [Capsaspora owczarzaki ATCC 30864]
MVFYFTSNVTTPPAKLYMGRDKYENEDLIKHGWPEDIWFHVDKLSSAHVYVRMAPGQSMDDISDALVQDCAQLTKANSIEGCKLNDVWIVYTPWANLKKTGDMAVGQVSFHNPRNVRKFLVEKKANEIINRLEKTKVERNDVDFKAERDERDRAEREQQRVVLKEQKRVEKEQEDARKKKAELQSFSAIMKPEKMKSNQDVKKSVREAEDDFM